jgi:hypothetical protein
MLVLLRLTASDYSFLYLQTVSISFLKERSEKNVKMIEDLPGEYHLNNITKKTKD